MNYKEFFQEAIEIICISPLFTLDQKIQIIKEIKFYIIDKI